MLVEEGVALEAQSGRGAGSCGAVVRHHLYIVSGRISVCKQREREQDSHA